jgi:uncharacterized membrane protein
LFTCILLALVGALLCASLTSAHLSGAGGLLAADCSDAGSGCGQVLASRWAVFPPADVADVRDGPAQTGVPVAALGLLYFAGLATWLAFVGLCRGQRAGWNHLVLQVIGAGCAVSILYAGIMLSQLDSVCPLCMGAHGANLALLAGFFAALRSSRPGRSDESSLEHPTPRLALASLMLGPCLGALLWQALQTGGTDSAAADLAARLDAIEQDAGLVELAYFADTRFTDNEQTRARFDGVKRPDDPTLPATDGASMTLVIFSDAECSACGRFERLLFDEIVPLFNGHLELVYKHFPLPIHEHAESAARALEAARLQGAFWEYQALLDGYRERLGSVDHADLAATLELDVQRFLADWASPATALRVAADISYGKNLGVDGTPSVFLNRRLVDPLTRGLLGFWSRRARALREAREARDQSW